MRSPHGTRYRRGKRGRNDTRRWCVPPAIMRDAGENLEYADVLSESRGDDGILFWNTLRSVTLWSEIPEELRHGLFRKEAAQELLTWINESKFDPRLEMALTSLNGVVAHPAEVSRELVVLMCADLSQWAEERGMVATAIAFAQAAAVADPEAPSSAVRVGHLALRSGMRPNRAETWLRRGVGLARRAKDWQTYALANIDLADLYMERGNLTEATAYLLLAMRVARRNRLTGIRAEALHRMCRVKMAQGELEDAEKAAVSARRAYGRLHPALPDLLFDYAYLMMLSGSHHRSISLLKRLFENITSQPKRARLLAVMARAAAGAVVEAKAVEGSPAVLQAARADAARSMETYRQSWSDAWLLLTGPSAVREADIILELARAAALANDPPRVEQAARLAATVLPGGGRTPSDRQVASAFADLAQTTIREGGR
jgi:tetratricopeptide (TPR) repeat protein